MTRFFDKLNLSAQERRVLVFVAVVVFLVLNAFFVWPQFYDLPKYQRLLANARKTLQTYQAEIAEVPANQAKLLKLEKLGSAVVPAEQALQLVKTVQKLAVQSSLLITGTRTLPPSTTSTNQYFDEQAATIDTLSTDQELVDFLVALGKSDSMIRVRTLGLKPDQPLYHLVGKLELVASYQKKPKATPAPPPAPRTNANPVTMVTNSKAKKP